jgi:hypothetical protein
MTPQELAQGLREEHGWTYERIGNRLGVSITTAYRLARNMHKRLEHPKGLPLAPSSFPFDSLFGGRPEHYGPGRAADIFDAVDAFDAAYEGPDGLLPWERA